MSNSITAPQLFARYEPNLEHKNRCFYCGGFCGEDYPASKHVKDSFTSLDTVTLSPWVCIGCIESQNERDEIALPGGELRTGQKVRGYSWVLDSECRIAATKSHREWLLDWCLVPPDPPYVICISDSGQKHLLYRAVVNWDRSIITVTLEGQPVTYRPDELRKRLDLCKRICAATGKPALSEPMNAQTQMRVIEYHDDESLLVAWLAVCNEPLSRLASWLCPPMKECIDEHPRAVTDT